MKEAREAIQEVVDDDKVRDMPHVTVTNDDSPSQTDHLSMEAARGTFDLFLDDLITLMPCRGMTTSQGCKGKPGG